MSDTDIVKDRADAVVEHDYWSPFLRKGYETAIITNYIRLNFCNLNHDLLGRAHRHSTKRLSSLAAADLHALGIPVGNPLDDLEQFLDHGLEGRDINKRLSDLNIFLKINIDRMTVVFIGGLLQPLFDDVQKAFEEFEASWTEVHSKFCHKDLSLPQRISDISHIRRYPGLRITGPLAPAEWWDLRSRIDHSNNDQLLNLFNEIEKIGGGAQHTLESLHCDMGSIASTSEEIKGRFEDCRRTFIKISEEWCIRDPEEIVPVALDRFMSESGLVQNRRVRIENLILALNWDLCERTLETMALWQEETQQLGGLIEYVKAYWQRMYLTL